MRLFWISLVSVQILTAFGQPDNTLCGPLPGILPELLMHRAEVPEEPREALRIIKDSHRLCRGILPGALPLHELRHDFLPP